MPQIGCLQWAALWRPPGLMQLRGYWKVCMHVTLHDRHTRHRLVWWACGSMWPVSERERERGLSFLIFNPSISYSVDMKHNDQCNWGRIPVNAQSWKRLSSWGRHRFFGSCAYPPCYAFPRHPFRWCTRMYINTPSTLTTIPPPTTAPLHMLRWLACVTPFATSTLLS